MKNWEDFLTAFDKGQDDVKLSWGPDRKPAASRTTSRLQQQHANRSKFVGGGITPKPTAVNKVSPKDQERIRKLEAMLNDKGATEGEKVAARAAIVRINSK